MANYNEANPSIDHGWPDDIESIRENNSLARSKFLGDTEPVIDSTGPDGTLWPGGGDLSPLQWWGDNLEKILKIRKLDNLGWVKLINLDPAMIDSENRMEVFLSDLQRNPNIINDQISYPLAISTQYVRASETIINPIVIKPGYVEADHLKVHEDFEADVLVCRLLTVHEIAKVYGQIGTQFEPVPLLYVNDIGDADDRVFLIWGQTVDTVYIDATTGNIGQVNSDNINNAWHTNSRTIHADEVVSSGISVDTVTVNASGVLHGSDVSVGFDVICLGGVQSEYNFLNPLAEDVFTNVKTNIRNPFVDVLTINFDMKGPDLPVVGGNIDLTNFTTITIKDAALTGSTTAEFLGVHNQLTVSEDAVFYKNLFMRDGGGVDRASIGSDGTFSSYTTTALRLIDLAAGTDYVNIGRDTTTFKHPPTSITTETVVINNESGNIESIGSFKTTGGSFTTDAGSFRADLGGFSTEWGNVLVERGDIDAPLGTVSADSGVFDSLTTVTLNITGPLILDDLTVINLIATTIVTDTLTATTLNITNLVVDTITSTVRIAGNLITANTVLTAEATISGLLTVRNVTVTQSLNAPTITGTNVNATTVTTDNLVVTNPITFTDLAVSTLTASTSIETVDLTVTGSLTIGSLTSLTVGTLIATDIATDTIVVNTLMTAGTINVVTANISGTMTALAVDATTVDATTADISGTMTAGKVVGQNTGVTNRSDFTEIAVGRMYGKQGWSSLGIESTDVNVEATVEGGIVYGGNLKVIAKPDGGGVLRNGKLIAYDIDTTTLTTEGNLYVQGSIFCNDKVIHDLPPASKSSSGNGSFYKTSSFDFRPTTHEDLWTSVITQVGSAPLDDPSSRVHRACNKIFLPKGEYSIKADVSFSLSSPESGGNFLIEITSDLSLDSRSLILGTEAEYSYHSYLDGTDSLVMDTAYLCGGASSSLEIEMPEDGNVYYYIRGEKNNKKDKFNVVSGYTIEINKL